MKKLILTSIAFSLVCLIFCACGGNSNNSNEEAGISAFNKFISMREKYKQIAETQGIDKAHEYEEQCREELGKNPWTFKVEIEPDIPITIESFIMGTLVFNLNTESIDAVGKYKRTGDGDLDNLNMVLYVDEKPVQFQRLENYPNESELHTAIWFQFHGTEISPEMRKINRIIITRKDKSHFQDLYDNVRKFIGEKLEPGDGTFVLSDKKLGPVTIGKKITNLPDKYNGLYDKFKYKKELHEDDMDGEWLEENYTFFKDGKEIFIANIYENKVSSIRLLKDATFISTTDGFKVGSLAKEVFNRIKADWQTYYEGTAFATKGHFTYHISMDDLIRTDIPNTVDQIKADAKICMIDFQ